jgi:hypothetical protein
MKGALAVQAGARAAATLLAYLYPDRAAAVDEIAERGRPRVALELGRSIGARVIARGRRDGSDAGSQGTIPVGPGLWVPTPPALAPPLEALAGTWRPWNISSGSRFRPDPPPAFGSRRYATGARGRPHLRAPGARLRGGDPGAAGCTEGTFGRLRTPIAQAES